MNIYFDIETIPAQDPIAIKVIKAEIEKQKLLVKAPSNYKDEEKIAAYIAAEVEKLDTEFDATYRKTSFDGGLGEICCIGYAIDDRPPVSISGVSEAYILKGFFKSLNDSYNPSSQIRPKFIGHNIINFDLRFLFQRAVMNNIKPPMMIPFNAKPWDESIFDTMTAWAGHGNRVRRAARLVKKWTGLKSGISTKLGALRKLPDIAKVMLNVHAKRTSA